MRRALALLCLTACDDPRVMRAILDLPAPISPAYPEGLDEVTLWLAHDGDASPLRSATFRRGQALAVPRIPFADDLVVHLSGEGAYGRTCPVAVDASGADLEPHLFFSLTGTFAEGPAPIDPVRPVALAATLDDGSALFLGNDGTVDSAVRFDPLAGSFTAIAARVAARQGAVLLAFGEGQGLVAGGTANGQPVRAIEVITPPGRTPVAAQEGPALVDHAGVTLATGAALVTGGRTAAGNGPHDQAWLFRRDADGRALSSRLEFGLGRARAGHSMTLFDDDLGRVLVAGGQDSAGMPIADAELFLSDGAVFVTAQGADLAVPRWGHRAVRLRGGLVLVVGGFTRAAPGDPPVPVAELEVWDPIAGFQLPQGGSLRTVAGSGWIDPTVTSLPDGSVLVAGGLDEAGEPTSVALVVEVELDGATPQVRVRETAPLAVPRVGHAAARLCDGTVLLVGGTTDAAAPGSERHNPPAAGRE